MRELALHITDLVENSIAAKSERISISVREDSAANRLCVQITDDGSGMTQDVVDKITNPFFTSRTTRRVGLGIPLLKAAAEACNGYLAISSKPGEGTQVTAEFQHDHIDRMPLGDLSATIRNMIICSPDVAFTIDYSFNDRHFNFENQPIMEALDGVSLTEPEILTYITKMISDGISSVQNGNN